MAIPAGYTIDTWFGEILNECHITQADLSVIRKYWSSLTSAQKTSLKNTFKGVIDTTVTRLNALKSDIDAL